jgi:type I restriction enzyme M protein
MVPRTGRCAILFPHGVLFRDEETGMPRKLVESDMVECVLGLGPGLFYNSPMKVCVVVCRSRKLEPRRGKILFIDAVGEIARERAQSLLRAEHQQRIRKAYQAFVDEPGFAAVVPLEDVLAEDGSLSITLYVKKPIADEGEQATLASAWAAFDQDGWEPWTRMDELVGMLDRVVAEEAGDA